MKNLKEMFPNHSESLIDRHLRQQNYHINATIATLLKTPPDIIPQNNTPLQTQKVMYPKQYQYQPPSQHQNKQLGVPPIQKQTVPQPKNSTYSNTSPISQQDSLPKHVFPSEFLRWPSNSHVIKTPIQFSDISGVNGNYIQPPPPKSPPLHPNVQKTFDFDMYAAQNHDPTQTIPDWISFKQKFAHTA